MEEYIDFSIAPYALPHILLALDYSGIKHFTITLEDWDLHVRINKKYVEDVVYPRKSEGPLTCCAKED